MFRNKKLFIFDLDGTVVDSTKVHAIAWQMALQEQGIEITPDEIMDYGKGMGYDERIATLQAKLPDRFTDEDRIKSLKKRFPGRELSEFNVPKLFEEKDNSFAKALLKIAPEDFRVPGILQFMLKIISEGGTIAIASNGKIRNVDLSLKHAGLADLIGQTEVAENLAEQKPKPFMLNKILKDNNASPHEAIFYGDNKADAQAAQAAGIDFSGITAAIPIDPDTTITQMKAYGAICIAQDFNDILRGKVKILSHAAKRDQPRPE